MLNANAAVRQMVREVRRDFCIRANRGEYGRLLSKSPKALLGLRPYEMRAAFLKVAELDEPEFEARVRGTAYFRGQAARRGEQGALHRCRSFRRLLHNLRIRYHKDRGHAPVVVFRPDGTYRVRLDGTHRITALRYLGHDPISCVCVTDDEYAAFVEATLPRDRLTAEMRRYRKWYQAVELLPGLWTRAWRAKKEGVMLPMLSALRGRTVLDLGCNDGLYSMEAARAGAKRVLGVDKRPETIEQAEFVQVIWSVTRPPSRIVNFRALDIREDDAVLGWADAMIAACVLYHLGDGLRPFMERLQSSNISTVIVQGNRARGHKHPWKPYSPELPAQYIYEPRNLGALFQDYGYRVAETVDGSFPVMRMERGK